MEAIEGTSEDSEGYCYRRRNIGHIQYGYRGNQRLDCPKVNNCTEILTHHDVFPWSSVEHRAVDVPVGAETVKTPELT